MGVSRKANLFISVNDLDQESKTHSRGWKGWRFMVEGGCLLKQQSSIEFHVHKKKKKKVKSPVVSQFVVLCEG